MRSRSHFLFMLCIGLGCSTSSEGPGSAGTEQASSSGDTAVSSTGGSGTSDTSGSGATNETSAGEACLPSPPADFYISISLDPLPPNQFGGTFEGECEVNSAANLELVLDCEDGVTLSVQQEADPPIDFQMVPSELSVRAFYVDGTLGNPATEVVVRDAGGTLIFAYSDRDAPNEQLEPPWRSSLQPLTVSVEDSDCEDELPFDCVTCTSRSLTVTDRGAEQVLLQGEEGTFGPWTLTAARLMSCEAICEGANPRMFSIGVVHDSVRR